MTELEGVATAGVRAVVIASRRLRIAFLPIPLLVVILGLVRDHECIAADSRIATVDVMVASRALIEIDAES